MKIKKPSKGGVGAEYIYEILTWPFGNFFWDVPTKFSQYTHSRHIKMGDDVEIEEIFDTDLLSGSEDEQDAHQEEALLGVDAVSD